MEVEDLRMVRYEVYAAYDNHPGELEHCSMLGSRFFGEAVLSGTLWAQRMKCVVQVVQRSSQCVHDSDSSIYEWTVVDTTVMGIIDGHKEDPCFAPQLDNHLRLNEYWGPGTQFSWKPPSTR